MPEFLHVVAGFLLAEVDEVGLCFEGLDFGCHGYYHYVADGGGCIFLSTSMLACANVLW